MALIDINHSEKKNIEYLKILHTPRLSILIATMTSRNDKLISLLNTIENQYRRCEVEIIVDANMGYNIGTKRNVLLNLAQGDYITYIDDDDNISEDYISKILIATETNPDCIGISGWMTTDGADRKEWHISREYDHWFHSDDIYYRSPNHISPVRRELALQIGFPEIAFSEDYHYSMRLLPLLKTEVKVQGLIYHYDFKSIK